MAQILSRNDYVRPCQKADGWETIAGCDVTDKRYRTTRYMLLYNPLLKANKAAILTATMQEPTKWLPFAEGKTYDMVQLFDRLDGKTLDG